MNKMAILAALVLVFLATTLQAETIRLRSGQVLVGKVEGSPDENGLLFRRLDNGGLLEVEWRHLMPGDVRRLKEKFELFDQAEEELLVQAQRFVIRAPGLGPQAHIGLVVDRTDRAIILRTRGREIPLPRDQIEGTPEWVQVPALEVYTPEEFYQAQLQEIQPGEDPARHEKLARSLLAAGYAEKAQEHFLRVLELDPDYRNKGSVERALRQVEATIAYKDIDDLMKRVRQAQSVKDYKRAMGLAATLDEKLPEMPPLLRQAWHSRREKLERDRQNWLAGQVARSVYEQVRRLASAKARDRDQVVEALRDYLEKRMAEEVFDRVTGALEIDRDEAFSLWNQREELRKDSTQSASYGDGTFILPRQRAHAGTSLEAKGSGQKKPSDDRAEIERRVREFLRQQGQRRQQGQQGRSGGQEPEEKTAEDWWRAAGVAARQQWVMAYFAEYGNLMKVRRVRATACPTCGGTGQITVQNLSGEEARQICPECHGHQIRRAVNYF